MRRSTAVLPARTRGTWAPGARRPRTRLRSPRIRCTPPSSSPSSATPSDREVIIELNRRREQGSGSADGNEVRALDEDETEEDEEERRVRLAASAASARARTRIETFLAKNRFSSSSECTTSESPGFTNEEEEDDEAIGAFIAEVRSKLDAFETNVRRRVCGRERELRLLLLSLFSQQHVLLLGPSGIGKSLLSDCVLEILDDDGDDRGRSRAFTFSRQLNRFTTPEELFGPLSVRELQKDAYVRLTDSYLPTATIAFLDEAFKASSSILNALLTILNERTFCENGSCKVQEKVPLLMCIFSSNEIPPANDTSVNALFDRILIRLPMKPLQGEELVRMLERMHKPATAHEANDGDVSHRSGGGVRLSREDILRVKEHSAAEVAVPSDVITLLKKLRVYLREALDVDLSDRRLIQIVQVLRVSACLNNRRFVNKIDCLLLQYMTWDHDVKNIPRVKKFIENQLLENCSSLGEWNKRRTKIFRDFLAEYFDGEVYMKGDSMSARYTAYRKGKLRQRQRQRVAPKENNGSPPNVATPARGIGPKTTADRIRELARETEDLVVLQGEFRGAPGGHQRSHQFLLGDLDEIQPKLMKSEKQVGALLYELYLLEECLNAEDKSPEMMVSLFPDTVAMFSKTWRTAL